MEQKARCSGSSKSVCAIQHILSTHPFNAHNIIFVFNFMFWFSGARSASAKSNVLLVPVLEEHCQDTPVLLTTVPLAPLLVVIFCSIRKSQGSPKEVPRKSQQSPNKVSKTNQSVPCRLVYFNTSETFRDCTMYNLKFQF